MLHALSELIQTAMNAFREIDLRYHQYRVHEGAVQICFPQLSDYRFESVVLFLQRALASFQQKEASFNLVQ